MAEAVREYAAQASDGEVLRAVGHGLSLGVGALLLMRLDYSYARLEALPTAMGSSWNGASSPGGSAYNRIV